MKTAAARDRVGERNLSSLEHEATRPAERAPAHFAALRHFAQRRRCAVHVRKRCGARTCGVDAPPPMTYTGRTQDAHIRPLTAPSPSASVLPLGASADFPCVSTHLCDPRVSDGLRVDFLQFGSTSRLSTSSTRAGMPGRTGMASRESLPSAGGMSTRSAGRPLRLPSSTGPRAGLGTVAQQIGWAREWEV
jgi:hypothetical protein